MLEGMKPECPEKTTNAVAPENATCCRLKIQAGSETRTCTSALVVGACWKKKPDMLSLTKYDMCIQVQWRNWMHGMPKYEVAPDTKFSDILVPTIDTVRSAHIIGMLLSNNKTVSWFTHPCLYFHLWLFCVWMFILDVWGIVFILASTGW